MKKKIILLLTIIIVSSCQNEDYSINDNLNLELKEKITLSKSTSKVSKDLIKMGVTNIFIEKKIGSTIYNPKTEKNFILNGENINLSDYSFILKNNFLTIKGNNNLKMSIYNKQPYIISNYYKGYAKDNQEIFNNKDFNILLIFMKELILNDKIKLDSKKVLQQSNKAYGCSFWNTYYVYGTGGTKSVAAENLTAELSEYSSEISGCRAMGNVDSSCVWENMGCISSQAYCCS